MGDKDVVMDEGLAADEARLSRARAVDDVDWPGPRGPQQVLHTDEVSVTLTPHDAGRISSITAFGHEILRQYQPGMRVFQYGAFPMTPWVGRIGGGLLYSQGRTYQLPLNQPPFSIHGLGRLGEWTTDEVIDSGAEQKASISLDLSPWWPWQATTSMSVEVKQASVRISETLAVSPDAATPGAGQESDSFPGQLGLHPWFRRHLNDDDSDDEASLEFYPDWQAQRGANGLPTGRRIAPMPAPWDDTFGFFPTLAATLVWEDLEMHISTSHSYATVFSHLKDAICVEPQTSIPNALNAAPGVDVVSRDRPLTLVTDLTFFSTK
jgi:aldose 1-epimerase